MPKEAARIFLRVTNVNCERLQDITERGAKAEGIRSYFLHKEHGGEWHESNCSFIGADINDTFTTRKDAFKSLWDSIYAKKDGGAYSWNNNPYVWVYEFEKVEVE
jgi:hypothetical protein